MGETSREELVALGKKKVRHVAHWKMDCCKFITDIYYALVGRIQAEEAR
jgi:hypothetical protein